ncbi:hypothetical protein BC830DRAFT_73645 [Chytriomyces sp. MP71]|nr:hypothetical protein BC830DRAFT_73645 [Chytriomyces sp. MP71]
MPTLFVHDRDTVRTAFVRAGSRDPCNDAAGGLASRPYRGGPVQGLLQPTVHNRERRVSCVFLHETEEFARVALFAHFGGIALEPQVSQMEGSFHFHALAAKSAIFQKVKNGM